MRKPGWIKPRSICEEVICLTDLLATCAAILGVELPHDAGEDSYNIMPVLLGQKLDRKPIREAIVLHSASGMFSIRQGEWKLILGRGSGHHNIPPKPEGQLYNIKEDPGETNNLWSEHPETVERLTILLEQYKKEGRSRS